MGLVQSKKANTSQRIKLEQFLKSINCRKDVPVEKDRNYTAWYVFHYLVIRTYNDKFVIHVFDDADHYDVEYKTYDTIDYSKTGLPLIWSILRPISNPIKQTT